MTKITDNYFALFELPESFSVNGSRLETTYREHQKRYHPDKYVNASTMQQLAMAKLSADVNDAYRTLLSPVLRIKHILRINGLSVPDENTTISDVGFLMEQMSLREELERIQDSQDPSLVEPYQKRVTSDIVDIEAQLRCCFDGIRVIDYDAVVEGLTKLQFLFKTMEEVDRFLDDLDDL